MNSSRLRLAYGGLHPDSVRKLLTDRGPAGGLRTVLKSPTTNPRVRAAVGISADTRLEELAKLGFGVVHRGEPRFPSRLTEREDCPDLLFHRGEIPQGPTVAVVGTRRCTAYGRNLATAYGRAVAEAGWILVSGLARGIDGAAHRGTVAAGGRGVAVLGCGLDIAYPREHSGLADELVARGGAIVSEYPPGTPPEAWRFPPRNRIISGLSQAVVVVEAAVKGGALITAHTALDQGIPVFATPGDVGKPAAAGCNALIRDGAQPVLDPSDLIEELQLVMGPAIGSPQASPWPWEGITVEKMAVHRSMTVAEATETLVRAELAGAVVRHGDRYYPSGH